MGTTVSALTIPSPIVLTARNASQLKGSGELPGQRWPREERGGSQRTSNYLLLKLTYNLFLME